MWTTERSRRLQVREAAAEVGRVTLNGDAAGVNLGGERRSLAVCSPGGYTWRPAAGDKVVVLKTGAEQEAPCMMGALQDGRGLKPGEVQLRGGSGTILLGNEGIQLSGAVLINGEKLEAFIENIARRAAGGTEG